jgi:hypothetical protein
LSAEAAACLAAADASAADCADYAAAASLEAFALAVAYAEAVAALATITVLRAVRRQTPGIAPAMDSVFVGTLSSVADYLKTGRAFTACTGRLLSNPSVVLKASSCSFEIVIGFFMTTQRTPSLQGGVVSDPL